MNSSLTPTSMAPVSLLQCMITSSELLQPINHTDASVIICKVSVILIHSFNEDSFLTFAIILLSTILVLSTGTNFTIW